MNLFRRLVGRLFDYAEGCSFDSVAEHECPNCADTAEVQETYMAPGPIPRVLVCTDEDDRAIN